jgi:hypothetical protein
MQLHAYALGVALGEMEELVPNLRAIAETYPARPFFRCALVHVQALLGDAEAERGFGELAADGFSRIPLDTEWLHAMSLLAETSVLLHDLERAEQLYRLLAPYAELNAVNVPEGVRGSMWRYLGLLAAVSERWDDAADHFSCALETNERLGLRPWLAATQEDFARMLISSNRDEPRVHQLLDSAIVTYRTLDMRPHAERAVALAQLR